MFDRVLSVLLTLSAITIAVALGLREFRGDRVAASSVEPPKLVLEWEQLADIGHQIGPRDALVRVVEFADLECPFCRQFHQSFAQVRGEVGDDISLLYVHFPLRSHRFAKISAVASECAAVQGRFEEFVEVVLELQDSLGLKPFRGYASDAGVPDLSAFESCLESPAEWPRIEQGVAHGEQLGVMATPTVIINGLRYSVPPNRRELREIVDSVRAERAATAQAR